MYERYGSPFYSKEGAERNGIWQIEKIIKAIS